MKEDYLMMPLKDKLQLLGRMKSDCEYYLGEGRKQITHLWGGTVDNQIRSMQELLSSILQENRPECYSRGTGLHYHDEWDGEYLQHVVPGPAEQPQHGMHRMG